MRLTALNRPQGIFAATLSVAILVMAAFAPPARAAAPSGEVLSPTPDGLHVREGKILFELQLTSGDAAPDNHVRIFWDFNWDGVDINAGGYDTCFPNPADCGNPDPGYAIPGYATPVRYNTAPGYPFRFVVDNTVTVYYAAPGQQKYRLKLLNADTNEFNTLTGTFIVDDLLTLGGYLWLGATTLPDGIDPPGWGSVSCANQNTICGTARNYNLVLKKSPAPAPVPTDARYGALFENTWFGVTRETPASHWWNLAYNYRVPLRVTETIPTLPGDRTGNTVVLKTRTRTLVDQALMRADRNDLRIVYWDGNQNTELDRDIFRPTTDFVSDEQEIRFKLMADLPDTAGTYYMYFANPAAGALPPNNPRNVYEYFEDFSTNVFSGNEPADYLLKTGLWRVGPQGFPETNCTGLYQVLGNRLVRRHYLGDGICNTWLRGPGDPNGNPNAYDFPVAEQDGTGFTYEGTFNLRIGDPSLTGGLFARDRDITNPANHDYSVAFIDQPKFCKPNSGQVPDSRHNFYTFCGTDTDCIDSPTPNPLTCQAEAPNQIAYRRNIKCPEGVPACETSGNGIFNQKVSTWDYPIATNTDYVVTWNEIRYNVNQQHVRVAVNGDLFQEFDDIGNEHPLRARPGITSYQPTTVPAGRPLAIEYDNLKVWTERGISVTVDGDLFNPLTFAKSENALGWFTFNRGVCTSGDPTLLGEYCRVNTECGPGPVPVPNCSNAASSGVPVAGDVEDWNSASTYGLNRIYAAPQGNCSVTTTTVCSVNQDCPVGQTCDEKRYPGQVAGWGRFLTLRDYGNSLPVPIGPQPNWGWTRLRGGEAKRGVCVGGLDNDRPCSAAAECAAPGICDTTLANVYTDLATGGYQSCLDCSGSIDGNSSNGDPGNGKCNICRNIQMTATQTEPIKAACSSCYDCNDSYTCTTCEYCSRYGVSFNARQAQLVGYAWAGGDMAEGGLGWVEFGPESGAISALQAWLATRYGDIFVKGDIGITTQLPAPPGSFNATYVIQSNGTIAFTSRAGYVQPNYPQPLGLPTRGTQYINVLGRLDFRELSSGSRYGTVATWPNPAQANTEINAWNSKLLEGSIYYVKGDLTINNPLTFLPGSGSASGAGTIIVDGDLTVNAPVTYDTATPAGTIVNIPSVAWLVRGNMTVSASVGTPKTDLNPGPNVVGAFLVVGCPSDGNYADGSGGNPCNVVTQDGQVRTGASSVLELIVNGLMMAKRFTFERTVPSTRGSEQIIYDGRLVANPPPGLQDLTAALPIIREVTP